MMRPSLLKLTKFLRLEAERNYDDGAVMGGLEKMLGTWKAEARDERIDEKLLTAISKGLKDYKKMTGKERAEAIQRLEKQLKGSGPETKREGPSKSPKANPKNAPRAKNEKVRSATPKNTVRVLDASPAAMDALVTVLDGVGSKNAERLHKLGIETLGDMLYQLPRRYDDYSKLLSIQQLKYGEDVTVIGSVSSKSKRRSGKRKMNLSEIVVDDGTAALRVSWFNQPWITKNIQEGDQVVLSGKIDQYLGRLTMTNPEMEMLDSEQLHTNRIVPVYPLTAKISQRWLRNMMNTVVSHWAPRIEDKLPGTIRDQAELVALPDALMQVHFPDSWEQLKAAQQRLAFDELFILQLAVLQEKQKWAEKMGRRFHVLPAWDQAQLGNLPFALTQAQVNSWADLKKDLASGRPMNRLLQGDVGSGKTVIAALGMAAVVNEGAQAAIMAPTSILAEQHFDSLKKLLAGNNNLLKSEEIALIIGATPQAEKKHIRNLLKSGEIKIIVGTHTLIEDPLVFSELEMIVIDEQHRFGVQQRGALRAKGKNPHLLVMTATPIPRSLALTLYGDLDLSVIDELPPGRKEVGTHILLPSERERAYSTIRKQVEKNLQAFIIYPLVEEIKDNSAKAAVDQHKVLQKEKFPELRVALIHGRLSAAEKEEVMRKFRDGAYDILVSTSVVEVGVDIPKASVMLIEGANRFGLAQLHQLRGRVGRGTAKSICILIPDNDDAAENERLKAMVASNDGFLLAEKDLEQRGPGQFLGRKQSGFATIRFASLSDARMISKARRSAQTLLTNDPNLVKSEHKAIQIALQNYWQIGKGDVS